MTIGKRIAPTLEGITKSTGQRMFDIELLELLNPLLRVPSRRGTLKGRNQWDKISESLEHWDAKVVSMRWRNKTAQREMP